MEKTRIDWKEKLTEILIEILIIVFAVSLSLHFERWREKQHDWQIENHFLTGLRYDLQSDIGEMSTDEFKSHELFSFLDNHLVIGNNGNEENLEKVLKTPIARNYLSRWDYPETIANRYQSVINSAKNIVTLIDDELK